SRPPWIWISPPARASSTRSGEHAWRLRDGRPVLRVVPVDDPRARVPERPQPVERGEHRLPVVHDRGQVERLERPAEIARVGREDDVAGVETDTERLVAGRVTVGREADDEAVAEEIVLAVDEEHVMAGVVVARIVVVGGDAVRVMAGRPLAPLDDEPGVR